LLSKSSINLQTILSDPKLMTQFITQPALIWKKVSTSVIQ
jgi:hypothetical protein